LGTTSLGIGFWYVCNACFLMCSNVFPHLATLILMLPVTVRYGSKYRKIKGFVQVRLKTAQSLFAVIIPP